MKLKKLLASILAAGLTMTCFTACDLDEDYDYDDDDYEYDEYDDDDDTDETGSNGGNNGGSGKSANSMSMSVDQESGSVNITRPESAETPMASDGSWTIFVYLCGTDLESEYGAATGDIEEMCYAASSDKVRFVIQTGGTQQWQNNFVTSGCGRYLVQDNDVVTLDEFEARNMGDPATLADFLTWGVQEYPAEHMGVILWNHGGGSISGVCFDELNDNDSLSVRELDSALYTVFENMSDRFEFIGFDACLMGTVETANILASYARYMYGSQETEPGNGWDYTEIGNYLASNPGANGAELGQVVADGFYESCKQTSEEQDATLSIIDLDKINGVIEAFNVFAKGMYDATEDTSVLTNVIRNIESADNFGGNNRSEGYTNMVDLCGLANACSDYADASAVVSAVDAAVVYNKVGSTHRGCCGLSIYYPLEVQGSTELKVLEDISISPFYSSFIDRQDFSSAINYDDSQGYDDGTYYDEETGCYYFCEGDTQYCYDQNSGEYYEYDYNSDNWVQTSGQCDYNSYDYSGSNDDFGYDDDYWFSDDSCWQGGSCMEYDNNSGCYRSRSVNNNHWDYADQIEATGESPYVKFLKEPVIDNDGIYSFTLTPKSVDRVSSVSAFVYQVIDDDALLLGETTDIYCDWDKGQFEDGFDGYWLSLPDGQNLSISVVAITDEYTVYSSPILLNGEETNLRFKLYTEDYSIVVEGAWDGIDDSGAAAKSVKQINSGDKIVPLYTSVSLVDDSDEETLWEGAEYVVSGSLELTYALLEEADYLYAFCIDDIYNDFYLTDFVEFAVDANGDTYFYIYEE